MTARENKWWYWGRAALAAVLALLLVAIILPSAGRPVIDRSVELPAHRVVWGVRECFPAFAIALGSLAFIYVGMWKRWAIEGLGWSILVALIVLAFFA
jgi:hypothetical protein